MEAEKQTGSEASAALVRTEGLTKVYLQRRSWTASGVRFKALDDVELTLRAGSTLAVVGPSGSGKSTLARCLARLENPSQGRIWFDGHDLTALNARQLMPFRRQIQLIFQDPVTALNPGFSAAEVVSEPLTIQGWGSKAERENRAAELMEQVGLPARWRDKRPLEFSGGQRQRLAIARALALQPRFLIFDEALSNLDLSIQAQIVNLMLELQAAHQLTYLYISHDLGVVGHLADEVAVMHEGRIVERGVTEEFFAHPQHPQSRALVATATWGHGGSAPPIRLGG